MQRTRTSHVAATVALVGAGIIASAPVPAPPPPPVKVAAVQNVDLMSLSSALVGVVEAIRTSVDTGAASLQTGLGQTRDTTYLTAKAIIDVAQEIDLNVTAALWEQAGGIPVLGPVVAQLIDGVGTVGYQGLSAVDLAIKISSQLAFDGAQFVPLEAAILTNFVADTLISLLSAVPAPLAAASTTGAPLREAAASSADSIDAGPVEDPGTPATKVVSDGATEGDGAITDAMSDESDGQRTPEPAADTADSVSVQSTSSSTPPSAVTELPEKAAETHTLTVSSSTDPTRGDDESSTDPTSDSESATDSADDGKSSTDSSSDGESSDND